MVGPPQRRLTLKSTHPHIGGDVPPWLRPGPVRREIPNPSRGFYVDEKVNGQIYRPQSRGYPDERGAAFLYNFVKGGPVTVSLSGDSSKWVRREHCYLERLKDLDEVWVVRFEAPYGNPWRLMGRFARQDLFLGLTAHRRKDLGGDAYRERALEFIKLWERLLPEVTFLRETTLPAYLRKPYIDVENPRIF